MKAEEIVAKEVARQEEFGYEPSWEDLVIAGQKAGIKTVVEFIRAERKCRHIDDVLYYPVYEKALETKEKEWGINEKI